MFKVDFTCEPLENIATEFKLLRRIAQHFVGWPQPPKPTGSITSTRTGENDMGQIYRLTLPLKSAQPDQEKVNDVVTGRVKAKFDGVDQPSVDTANEQATLEPFVVPDGTVCDLAFVFVDDAGNESDPLPGPTFTASDTESPPAPVGEFGIERIGEE